MNPYIRILREIFKNVMHDTHKQIKKKKNKKKIKKIKFDKAFDGGCLFSLFIV